MKFIISIISAFILFFTVSVAGLIGIGFLDAIINEPWRFVGDD